MKKIIISSLVLSQFLFSSQLQLPEILKNNSKEVTLNQETLEQIKFKRTGPTIQIAILLDTSSSMDGLINQAKEQIWNLVNEVSKANKDNKEVSLQVSLYEYGKSTLSINDGYIKMLSPLTNDLDFLSEILFDLKTNGGEEYAGEVINKAVDNLYWSDHEDDLKIIIIAGMKDLTKVMFIINEVLEKLKEII